MLTTKSGKPINPIGIGTWLVGGKWEAGKQDEPFRGSSPVYGREASEAEALRYSIAQGQNHIDTAELYGTGHTEEVVGQAIAGLPREDLFIADKLWRTNITPEKVRPAVQGMLTRLGTPYIDLLYIHWPWDNWQAAVPCIDELIEAGTVRHFGVSNFTIAQMREAVALAKHPVAANQMNYNVLYKEEVNGRFLAYCREHGIQLVAYQPVKRKEVLEDAVVQGIAAAHQAAPAQVALAWLLQKGAWPIPKATQKPHIDENIAAAKLHLSAPELAQLDKL